MNYFLSWNPGRNLLAKAVPTGRQAFGNSKNDGFKPILCLDEYPPALAGGYRVYLHWL
jgi:hypothetical protein